MQIELTEYQASLVLQLLKQDFHSLSNTYEQMVDDNEAKDLIFSAFNAKKAVLEVIQQLTKLKEIK